MDKQTSDYRRAELDKVQATADDFPRKIKIIAGDGGGTKWLNISDLEFECIDKLLVVGATKSKRERELEALVKISIKSEEYWRTQCELMAQKIDGLRYEIDTLEEHMETLVGVK